MNLWIHPAGKELRLTCQLCNPHLVPDGPTLVSLQAGVRIDVVLATFQHHFDTDHAPQQETGVTTAYAQADTERRCEYCGEPIEGAYMTATRQVHGPGGFEVPTYYHADTGPYGPRVLPTCLMIVAEADALVARGWKMPPGCVTWIDTARVGEAKTRTATTRPGPDGRLN